MFHQLTPSQIERVKLLSHSSLELLHACPRKFLLYRLNASGAKTSSVDTAYGHALGAAIQSLFLTSGDTDTAIFEAFKAWDLPLSESKPKVNKDFWNVVTAVEYFAANILPAYASEWEVAYFNDKPAIELSFSISLPNNYKYRGYIDLVLRHKETGIYKVIELKTTGAYGTNEAKYRNSFQGIGYGVVLDAISGGNADYFVDYIVYYTKSRTAEIFPFLKSNMQKIVWLQQLQAETARLDALITGAYFPMHGESCYDFMSPCFAFGICEMSLTSLVNMDDTSIADSETYSFNLTWEDIVASSIPTNLINPAATAA